MGTSDPQRLVGLLGIERPVLCAPMARIAGGRLAAAVSDAGGLGFIGGGYGDRSWIAEQVGRAGSSRIGIGIVTWNLAPGALEVILEHRPAAVWLSFGDPSPYIPLIHQASALVVCQVGTVDEALQASEAGADVLVAQGAEAGGHGRGLRSLFGLLPALRSALPDTPIVAAGGIGDVAGYQAARALGADGVALGSRYYATPEALDSDAAKAQLVQASGGDTVRSRVYDHIRGPVWPEGFSGRTLRTPLTDDWAGREHELAPLIDDLRADHEQAVADDDFAVRVVFAGDGLDTITAVEAAAEITRRFPQVAPA